jgi:hypothetical protein
MPEARRRQKALLFELLVIHSSILLRLHKESKAPNLWTLEPTRG